MSCGAGNLMKQYYLDNFNSIKEEMSEMADIKFDHVSMIFYGYFIALTGIIMIFFLEVFYFQCSRIISNLSETAVDVLHEIK